MASDSMAEIHKKLKTIPECMKHMVNVMDMKPDAARTRCNTLISKNKKG